MKQFNKHIAVFLLLISALFIVPKELIHELTCHDDTVDHHFISEDGLAIGTVHHHCDILQLFVPAYHTSDGTVLFSETIKIISHYPFHSHAVSFELVDSFVIRGPPPSSSFFC